jgi:uncharacterized protein YdbL (DUF1318 family)
VFTGDDGSTLDRVPEDVDSLAHVDFDDVRTETAIEETVDGYLDLVAENDSNYDGPEDFEALQAEIENDTDLAYEDLHAVTSFSKEPAEAADEPSDAYSGLVIRADWSESDLVGAIEDDEGVDLTEREYEGVTVYESEGGEMGPTQWLAAPGDGFFVYGSEEAVKDSIDTFEGDADPVGGELREVYDDAPDGYVKFASAVPQEEVPDREVPAGGASLDVGAFKNVEFVAGAMYAEDDTLGTTVRFHVEDEDSARDTKDVLQGAVSLLRGFADDGPVKDVLRGTEVTRDGTTVSFTHETTVEKLLAALAELDEAGGDSEDVPPQAGASVNFDEDADEVTTTWTSNQNADSLTVEYEVLSGPGQGEGAELQEVGDSHTFEAEDGAEIRVKVLAHAGDQSVVILEYEGEL